MFAKPQSDGDRSDRLIYAHPHTHTHISPWEIIHITINPIFDERVTINIIKVVINIRIARTKLLTSQVRVYELKRERRVSECLLASPTLLRFPYPPHPCWWASRNFAVEASMVSARLLIKTQGDWGDKRAGHENDRMLVRCRSTGRSFNQRSGHGPFVRSQRGRWNVSRMRYRDSSNMLAIERRVATTERRRSRRNLTDERS